MMQETTTPVMDDPLDAATNATLRPREYYGQLSVDAYFAKLVKGTGKVPFDSQKDPIEQRVTAVTLALTPLPECDLSFNLAREMIAESVEWVRVVWPSLRAAGVQSAKSADGIWVRLIQEPTGRKYRGRDGAEREASTFKVLGAFADESACRAAYLAASGKVETSKQDAFADEFGEALSTGGSSHKTQPVAQPQAKQKETAAAFVAALAKQHHGDMAAIKAAVASIPLITNAFDPESEEFAQIVAENAA